MKKILVLLILAFILIAPVSALTDNEIFASWSGALRPQSSSMGNAGLFLRNPENVLRNPSLVDRDWHVVLPSVSISVYNMEENVDVFRTLLRNAMTGGDIVSPAIGFLNNIPGGFKDFIELDGHAYLGFPYGGLTADFGFGLMTDGNGDVTSSVVSHVNASFILSGGYEFEISDGYTASVGFGIGARYKMASMDSTGADGIGVDKVSDVIQNTKNGFDIPGAINELFRNGIQYSTGWSYPMSIGVTFGLPYGFTCGLDISNINGDHHMYSYNEMDDAWHGDFEGGEKGKPFCMKSIPDVSVGAAWEMDNFLTPWWLRASAALDFVDIIGFWRDVDFKDFPGYVEHVRMGAAISFLTAFEIRAGLDRGYFTAGAGLNLWGNRLDLIYGVKPYGKVKYGDSLDHVSLIFTLGWEDY